jgi:hypothetical protein
VSVREPVERVRIGFMERCSGGDMPNLPRSESKYTHAVRSGVPPGQALGKPDEVKAPNLRLS